MIRKSGSRFSERIMFREKASPGGGSAQALRSNLTVVRPVPAQALQMIRSPRSRTRPVPQHRTQVSCMTGAGRVWRLEFLFPKSIRMAFVLMIVSANQTLSTAH
jgi:hypothetical protein